MTLDNLAELVERLRALTAEQGSGEVLAKGTAEYLADFNVDAIPPEFRRRSPDTKRGRYMLHREPLFNITTVIWAPGERTDPHDHRTWGTILVVENEIEETRYALSPAHEQAARLEVVAVERHQGGALSTLFDGNDVHSMFNTTDADTLEIHIYGDDLAGMSRSWWQPDGTEETFVSPSYQNC